MKRIVAGILGLTLLLAGSLSARAEPKADPPKDPYNYDELFSFPPKIKLDEKQQASLAELRKSYEPAFAAFWKQIAGKKGTVYAENGLNWAAMKERKLLVRKVTRQKIALLTDAQKQALGVVIIPSYALKKALTDPKVWDVEQLEKVYVIQSRSYDPEEDVISFTVMTKKPWTDLERASDRRYWSQPAGALQSQWDHVQAIFYDKNDVKVDILDATRPYRGMSRAEAKLTDKEAAAGLQRFRIKIDLSLNWDAVKDAASVKIVYPWPKADEKDK